MMIAKERNGKKDKNFGRANLVLAAVFLLAGTIIFRLYRLQIANYDYYAAAADRQHEASGLLQASRGKIYMSDGSDLYPVATDKDFAEVYVKPNEVEQEKIQETAEIFFNIFNKEEVNQVVDEIITQKQKEAFDNFLANPVYLIGATSTAPLDLSNLKIEDWLQDNSQKDYWQTMRDTELENKKKEVIDGYLKKLSKENDPYELIAKKVDEKKLAELLSYNIVGLDYDMKNYRYYPEKNIGANVLGFVSYEDGEMKGKYGLEGFFDKELSGQSGSVEIGRDGRGRLSIVNDMKKVEPKNGSDLLLTIDRSIQFFACKKLDEAVQKHGASGGSLVVIKPDTGEVMAMCSSPDFDPNNFEKEKTLSVFNNQAIFDQYEPGSIFKVLTMAAGLDQEKVSPETTYNDTGQVKIANYTIQNSDKKANGISTMTQVLEKSLNTGVIFVMRATGADIFKDYLKNFGFGEKTGIELEGESSGDINNLLKTKDEIYPATASYGQGISVTPLQMAAAYAAIANGGVMMKPHVVKQVKSATGEVMETKPIEIRRIISEKAAMLLSGMMVQVIENGHGKQAGVKGYYVAGKTGTAQIPRKDGRGYEDGANIGSFAGFAPADNPAFAMIVRIDRPRDVAWAESSAAPLFGEISEFILNYLKIPQERK